MIRHYFTFTSTIRLMMIKYVSILRRFLRQWLLSTSEVLKKLKQHDADKKSKQLSKHKIDIYSEASDET